MKLVVLDSGTMRLNDADWQSLRALGEVTLYENTSGDVNLILERIADAEVVICNKVPISAEICERAPRLKLITLLATGVNNVDLPSAKKVGIMVCNVPAYSTVSVAQHTFALLLELTNRVSYYNQSVQAGDWISSEHFCYWNHELPDLDGKTIGIIGFGDIGRRVGTIANAFGMRVMASMRTPRDAPDWEGFEFASNEEIFAKADVITLHCPQTPENHHFVNEALLRTCKPTAILINTGRGGLIGEEDLRKAIDKSYLAGAALDVVDGEPMREDSPLLGCPQIVITPHIAWASRESRLRLLNQTVANINAYRAGESVNRVV